MAHPPASALSTAHSVEVAAYIGDIDHPARQHVIQRGFAIERCRGVRAADPLVSALAAIAEDDAQRLVNAHQIRDALEGVMGQACVWQVFVFIECGAADSTEQGALLLGATAPMLHEAEEELQRNPAGFGGVELFAWV